MTGQQGENRRRRENFFAVVTILELVPNGCRHEIAKCYSFLLKLGNMNICSNEHEIENEVSSSKLANHVANSPAVAC